MEEISLFPSCLQKHDESEGEGEVRQPNAIGIEDDGDGDYGDDGDGDGDYDDDGDGGGDDGDDGDGDGHHGDGEWQWKRKSERQ